MSVFNPQVHTNTHLNTNSMARNIRMCSIKMSLVQADFLCFIWFIYFFYFFLFSPRWPPPYLWYDGWLIACISLYRVVPIHSPKNIWNDNYNHLASCTYGTKCFRVQRLMNFFFICQPNTEWILIVYVLVQVVTIYHIIIYYMRWNVIK